MSIVHFKQAAFKKESQWREKRVDFATMIPSLKQFGIQEMKRKADGLDGGSDRRSVGSRGRSHRSAHSTAISKWWSARFVRKRCHRAYAPK